MFTFPKASAPSSSERERLFGRTRVVAIAILVLVLALCFLLSWSTRDAMQHRVSLRGNPASLVDMSPWQTAQMLASLAVSSEEDTYARQAERLADHDVDQAFAAALREATLRTQHRNLSGPAQQIAQKIATLQQLVAQDQETVRKLAAAKPAGSQASTGSDQDSGQSDLDIAKAQLALDLDELDDANRDLERATGDQRSEIQNELAAHEQSMKKYDAEMRDGGQMATVALGRLGTLASRIRAWTRQRARLSLIAQARQQALSTAANLTAKHNALEQAENARASTDGSPGAATNSSTEARGARLAGLKNRSLERQLITIYDDRIQTEQELALVYEKWAAQVKVQHRILLHLMMDSIAWIVFIVIGMVLGDGLVQRLADHPALERRQRHTLRAILGLAIQIIGGICILLVIFGVPKQTSTMIGLTTAALTIALQDFVLAFFGWFVLMGSKGIRMGDAVEIDGVGGEVIEIGLLSTTLLETGPLNEHGYPTGRRISFMNGFAIRGKYFNFSTAGQWMIDHFEITVPSNRETPRLSEEILRVITTETVADAHKAEQEWKRSLRGESVSLMHASADVHLRPSGSDFIVEIRYVTRASNRAETRNRLYRSVIDLLDGRNSTAAAVVENAPQV